MLYLPRHHAAFPIGFGTATRLNGGSDQLSRSTNLPPITGFTLMGWFRTNDQNAYSTYFSYGQNGTSVYTIQTDASGTAMVLWDGSSEVALGISLVDDVWAHIAMTVSGTSGSNFLGYVNGLVGTAHVAHAITGSSLIVGESHGGGERLDAACAALKFYDVVLTAAEIRREMTQYLPVRTAGLNAFYPLCGPSANTAILDHGCFKRHLTAAGTLTFEAGPPLPWTLSPPKRLQWVDAPPAGGGGGTVIPVQMHNYRRRRVA